MTPDPDINKKDFSVVVQEYERVTKVILPEIILRFNELRVKEEINHLDLMEMVQLKHQIIRLTKYQSHLFDSIPLSIEELKLKNVKLIENEMSSGETDLFFRQKESIAHSAYILFNIAQLAEAILDYQDELCKIVTVKWIKPVKKNLVIHVYNSNHIYNRDEKRNASICGSFETAHNKIIHFYCNEIESSCISKKGFFANQHSFIVDMFRNNLFVNKDNCLSFVFENTNNISDSTLSLINSSIPHTILYLIDFILIYASKERMTLHSDVRYECYVVCKIENMYIPKKFGSIMKNGIQFIDERENAYINSAICNGITMIEQFRILPFQREGPIRMMSLGYDLDEEIK